MKTGKTLVVVVLAIAIALVGTVAVSAQGPENGSGPRASRGPRWRPNGGSFMEGWAEELGISVDRMKEAAESAWGKIIGKAVDDGDLTEEQADRILERKAPFTWDRMPFEKGIMAEIITPEERHAAMADLLGMTPEELQAELDDGAKLRDLIEDAGLDHEAVKGAMDELWTTEITKAVEEDLITQEQADKLLDRPAFPGRFQDRRQPRRR